MKPDICSWIRFITPFQTDLCTSGLALPNLKELQLLNADACVCLRKCKD